MINIPIFYFNFLFIKIFYCVYFALKKFIINFIKIFCSVYSPPPTYGGKFFVKMGGEIPPTSGGGVNTVRYMQPTLDLTILNICKKTTLNIEGTYDIRDSQILMLWKLFMTSINYNKYQLYRNWMQSMKKQSLIR